MEEIKGNNIVVPFDYCFRMNENMEFPDMSGEDIEWLQDSFVKVIFGRIEESLANRRMKKEDAGKVSNFLTPKMS